MYQCPLHLSVPSLLRLYHHGSMVVAPYSPEPQDCHSDLDTKCHCPTEESLTRQSCTWSNTNDTHTHKHGYMLWMGSPWTPKNCHHTVPYRCVLRWMHIHLLFTSKRITYINANTVCHISQSQLEWRSSSFQPIKISVISCSMQIGSCELFWFMRWEFSGCACACACVFLLLFLLCMKYSLIINALKCWSCCVFWDLKHPNYKKNYHLCWTHLVSMCDS